MKRAFSLLLCLLLPVYLRADNTAGFNFRATSGYVTDVGAETYVLAESYPTTRSIGGVSYTFGWDVTNGIDSRDRNSGVNRRLAGMNFVSNTNGGSKPRFRVTLLATGDTTICASFGDQPNTQTHYVRFQENGSTFATISNVTTNTDEFADATGTVRTIGAWDPTGAQCISRTFSSTIFQIEIGDPATTAGNSTAVTHLFVNQVTGGAGGTNKRLLMGVGASQIISKMLRYLLNFQF
jgi:hypothetical protein